MSPESTLLYDRIHASLIASAIGDAMGGPVEGWTYGKIADVHGVVDDLLPYTTPPDYHNHFVPTPGTVTDDTRLRHLVAQAILDTGAAPRRADLVWAIVTTYHRSLASPEQKLTAGFLEEYALGGVYGETKLIWGGQMTNGFLMANAPLGLICPCDPEAAFALSFAADFISDGYAKYSAAMGAAAVAAAMAPPATPESVVEAALAAAQAHRVEGLLTRGWEWYDHIFCLNERLLQTSVEIALRHRDVFSLRAEYYDRLRVSDLGSEAAQTLAVALGMLVAADGDLAHAIIGCVNYGRDNDSYATLAGAIAGAMHGTGAIPAHWRSRVEAANPEPDMSRLAAGLAEVVLRQHGKQQQVVAFVADLLSQNKPEGDS